MLKWIILLLSVRVFPAIPKKAWNLLNAAIRPKCKSHIGSIRTSAGEFTSPSDIVNLFNNHSLFSSLPPANFDFVNSCSFHFAPITADVVLDTLQLLNVDRATGPDGLSACILKVSAPAIADSLAALFNASLNDAAFPSDWKQANVYPVFKASDSCLLTNYRPIQGRIQDFLREGLNTEVYL